MFTVVKSILNQFSSIHTMSLMVVTLPWSFWDDNLALGNFLIFFGYATSPNKYVLSNDLNEDKFKIKKCAVRTDLCTPFSSGDKVNQIAIF